MSPEIWTMIGLSLALAGLILAQYRFTRQNINRVEEKLEKKIEAIREEISTLRECMAKLEGLLEGLREAITGRRAA